MTSFNVFSILMMLFMTVSSAQAFETDPMSKRHLPLAPVDEIANRKMNEFLDEGVAHANRGKHACDVGHLYAQVRKSMGNWVVGRLEKYLERSPEVPRHEFTRKDSIYNERTTFEKIRYQVGLRGAIRLGGQYIGIDKTDHFIDQGYDYFTLYVKTKSLDELFAYGRKMESSYFGAMLTGIFSYGDLTANYEGFRFWSQLAAGDQPYYKCENGQWTKARIFTWSDYVNPAWDEGINCSESRTSQMKKTGCGLEREACQKMARHYGLVAPHILNPACLIRGD